MPIWEKIVSLRYLVIWLNASRQKTKKKRVFPGFHFHVTCLIIKLMFSLKSTTLYRSLRQFDKDLYLTYRTFTGPACKGWFFFYLKLIIIRLHWLIMQLSYIFHHSLSSSPKKSHSKSQKIQDPKRPGLETSLTLGHEKS